MEIITFDFNNSTKKMDAFRQRVSESFAELALSAETTGAFMKEKFLDFSQETNLAFLTTSAAIPAPFNEAYFTLRQGFSDAINGMREDTVMQWAQLEPDFSETWANINEAAIAFLAQFDAEFSETWDSISASSAVFAEGLQGDFAVLWVVLENGVTEFWEIVGAIMDAGYLSIDENSTAFRTRLSNGFGNSWADISENSDSTLQSIEASANDLNAKLTDEFSDFLSMINDRFQNLYSRIREDNSDLWSETDKASSALVDRTKECFGGMRNQISSENDRLWLGTIDGSQATIENVRAQFEKLWKFVSDGTRNMSETVSGMFNNLFGGIENPINSFIRLINKIPFVDIPELDLSFTAPAYAQGGFPSQGQMFIAREAGPELVGTIGNRSAVVNNDQIIESVSQGVYEAVRAAMSSGRSSKNGVAEFNLYLDGDKLGSRVTSIQNRQNRIYGKNLQQV